MSKAKKCNKEHKEEIIIIYRPRCGKLYSIKKAKGLYTEKNEVNNERGKEM
jgi:hypothetical protein